MPFEDEPELGAYNESWSVTFHVFHKWVRRHLACESGTILKLNKELPPEVSVITFSTVKLIYLSLLKYSVTKLIKEINKKKKQEKKKTTFNS